jgi:putative endonuclease
MACCSRCILPLQSCRMPGLIHNCRHKKLNQYYVYILECSDKTLHAGWTRDIDKRIKEHNCGKNGARDTRSSRPVRLVYVEGHVTLSDALKREAWITKQSRVQKGGL